jgi:hypothetical protein
MTVIRAIKELEAVGLISIQKQDGKANRYDLHTSTTVIPVSERYPSQSDTAPVSERYPTSTTVIPEQEITGKNRNSRRKKFTDEHMAVAKEMADILELTKKPNLDSWANDVRLMVERDGHTCPEVMTMFRAANAHEFWRANIMCPGKLRDKWDQLRMQLKPKAADVLPMSARYVNG